MVSFMFPWPREWGPATAPGSWAGDASLAVTRRREDQGDWPGHRVWGHIGNAQRTALARPKAGPGGSMPGQGGQQSTKNGTSAAKGPGGMRRVRESRTGGSQVEANTRRAPCGLFTSSLVAGREDWPSGRANK
jgi:hypothetical protein